MKNAETQPLIVAGDFNSPSHLDWVEETKWENNKIYRDSEINQT